MTVEQMDAKFMDGLLRRLLKDLKDCIAERGDFYCAFRSTGHDGDLDVCVSFKKNTIRM